MPVVDEIEGEALLSLYRVAEHLTGGKEDAEVRIVTHSSYLIIDYRDTELGCTNLAVWAVGVQKDFKIFVTFTTVVVDDVQVD